MSLMVSHAAQVGGLLHGTEWYHSPPQASLTTSIVGGGGLGSFGASHAQGHESQVTTGAFHAQGHGGGFQTAEGDFMFYEHTS